MKGVGVENDGFMGELYIAYGQNGDGVGVILLVVLLKLSLLVIILSARSPFVVDF